MKFKVEEYQITSIFGNDKHKRALVEIKGESCMIEIVDKRIFKTNNKDLFFSDKKKALKTIDTLSKSRVSIGGKVHLHE